MELMLDEVFRNSLPQPDESVIRHLKWQRA